MTRRMCQIFVYPKSEYPKSELRSFFWVAWTTTHLNSINSARVAKSGPLFFDHQELKPCRPKHRRHNLSVFCAWDWDPFLTLKSHRAGGVICADEQIEFSSSVYRIRVCFQKWKFLSGNESFPLVALETKPKYTQIRCVFQRFWLLRSSKNRATKLIFKNKFKHFA